MPLDKQKIMDAAAEHGIDSVSSLAAQSGIHPVNLINTLNGRHDPKLSTVESIARTVKRKVSEILVTDSDEARARAAQAAEREQQGKPKRGRPRRAASTRA